MLPVCIPHCRARPGPVSTREDMLWCCARRFEGHRVGWSLLCVSVLGAVCLCFLCGCTGACLLQQGQRWQDLAFRCRVGRMCAACLWKGIDVRRWHARNEGACERARACAPTSAEAKGPLHRVFLYLSINSPLRAEAAGFFTRHGFSTNQTCTLHVRALWGVLALID